MIDCSLPGFGPKHVFRWLQKRTLNLLRRRPTAYLRRGARMLRSTGVLSRGTTTRDRLRRNAFRRNGEYARLIRQYRPHGTYHGKVLFIQSADDPIRVPAYGWRDLAAALNLQRVPGEHMRLLETPAIRRVAEVMRAALAESTRGASQASGEPPDIPTGT
jgi:thioesterase domain-containing protein